SIENELPDTKPLAHLGIERRRHLELPPFQPHRDITMIDEQVGPHQFRKLRRIQMIADIRKSDGRRNAGGAQSGGQEDSLWHAIIRRLPGDPAGAILVRDSADLEWIVSDLVADCVEQADRRPGWR